VQVQAYAEDTCAVPENGSAALASISARDRIEFLRSTLDDQARYVRRWKWAWVGIGSAAVVASGALTIGWAAGNDPHVRDANVADNLVATVFSVFTPIVTVVFAPRVESDAPVIDRLLADTGNGEAGACLVLARVEELFAKGAEEEAFATGVLAHLASLLGVAALFGIMAVEAALATDPLARDAHWENAVINGLAGVAYAEAQILTTPTGAVKGWRSYLKGDLHRKSAAAFSVQPLAIAPGLMLRMTFE
jgi:hypothetical protein